MDIKSKNNRFKVIFKYFLFIFSFVLVGFTFSSTEIDALSVKIGDIDYANNNIKFDVSFETDLKHIKYTLTDGDGTVLCNGCSKQLSDAISSKIEGASNVYTFQINVGDYSFAKKNTDYKKDVKRNFKIEAEVATKWKLFIGSKTANDSKDFTFSPSKNFGVSKVEVSTTSTNVVPMGGLIKFLVSFTESVRVSSSSIEFKIGENNKTIKISSCLSNSFSTSLECSYRVQENDGNGKINSVNLAFNVENLYDQKFDKSYSAYNIAHGNFSVDSIRPTIVSVTAKAGIYSSEKMIPVTLTFSENLFNEGEINLALELQNINKEVVGQCALASFNSGENKAIYNCIAFSSDYGVNLVNNVYVKTMFIDGNNNLKDAAGNQLNLSNNWYEIESEDGDSLKIVINNNAPEVSAPSIDVSECLQKGEEYYCNQGSKIVVVFYVDDSIGVSSLEGSVKISFGGNTKNMFVQTDPSNNKIMATYIIDGDNGVMNIFYTDLKITGLNNQYVEISGENIGSYVYADTKEPVIGGVYYEKEKLETEQTIYSKKGNTLNFKINVDDVSEIVLNSEFTYLVNSIGQRLSLSEEGIKSYSFEKEENSNNIIVAIELGENCENVSFKLVVDEEAIKDYFEKTNSAQESNLIHVDCKVPEFGFSIDYPDYKGYEEGDSWYLIGGNYITYFINSSDLDLKDYCVASIDKDFCEEENYVEFSGLKQVEGRYVFTNDQDGEYEFTIYVRDTAGNITKKTSSFVIRNMFSYDNEVDEISKNHSVTVDLSLFDNGTNFKYAWFKKGDYISFSNATVTSKQFDSIVVDGSSEYHGLYKLCINRISDNTILCSEELKFDNDIDLFEVDYKKEWTNKAYNVSIKFNDASIVKCVAIGKNYSNLNCDGNNENMVVYKGAQLINPLNKYSIEDNGLYYFYIEDAVGNKKVITEMINNIDREAISIEIYNGKNGGSNLELEHYKNKHEFLVTFDKSFNVGSTHSIYKYFFSTARYDIFNEDVFNSYYLNNIYSYETTACNKKLNIVTPNENGVYFLYIMAKDYAGNFSFNYISDIKVDIQGPSIKMYDLNNNLTGGGSMQFIVDLDYYFIIEESENESGLDLATVRYSWIDSNGEEVFSDYYSCNYSSTVCKINGSDIRWEKDKFDSSLVYKLIVTSSDNAGNVGTFETDGFKIDTKAPTIILKDKEGNAVSKGFYNYNKFKFVVVEDNANSALDSLYYCLNDCLKDNKFDINKSVNLLSNNDNREFNRDIILPLNEGDNKLYIYAVDRYGNNKYEIYDLTYDLGKPIIEVSDVDNGVIDMVNKDDKYIYLKVRDEFSGVSKYCVNDDCFDVSGLASVDERYLVSLNGNYTIKAFDRAGNEANYVVSVIVGVDEDAPFVNTNKNNGKDRIYLEASNLEIEVIEEKYIYKYANETLYIVFSENSLMDKYTQFNNYIGLRLCFDAGECNYETYDFAAISNGEGYIYNLNMLRISAPYNFSGAIYYYLVDAAGNSSKVYSFTVKYQDAISDFEVKILDKDGQDIVSSTEYNSFKINFVGNNVNTLIQNEGVYYTVLSDTINLRNKFANNKDNIYSFLNSNGFVKASDSIVSLTSVDLNSYDGNYNVWVYVKDSLNNHNLIKADSVINLDTIAPEEGCLNLISLYKVDSSNFDLNVSGDFDYDLLLDLNNDGVYETKVVSNRFTFNVNAVSSVNMKIVDKAGNYILKTFDLNNLATNVYARAYLNKDSLSATVVIYNLGEGNVTSFKYITTSIHSTEIFDENSIGGLPSCTANEETCVNTVNKPSNNVYTISLSSAKKVIFYIYVNGNLVYYDNNEDKTLLSLNVLNDTNAPRFEYEINNDFVDVIGNEFYAKQAINAVISDESGVSLVEVYTNNELYSKCDVLQECNGFEIINDKIYFELDTGNYFVKAYDLIGNVREISVYVDRGDPVIELHKYSEGSYVVQDGANKIFNILDNLYVRVRDDNFSSFAIDLKNSLNHQVFENVVRYTNMSSTGKCISDDSVCEYGANLKELLSDNRITYDQIIVRVLDKANRETKMIISYDDIDPIIWVKDVGETVYINGVLYTVKEDSLIEIEINYDKNLDIDTLLNKFITSIDGKKYSDVKNKDRFSLVARDGNDQIIDKKDILKTVGINTITIGYIDEANNVAENKVIKIKVKDSFAPYFEVDETIINVNLNEASVVNGVVVKDNYDTYEKLSLSDAVCNLVLKDGNIGVCEDSIKFSDGKYTFKVAGVYSFTYTVKDTAQNESSIMLQVVVSDNKGPEMSFNGEISKEIEIVSLSSIEEYTFIYPSSKDVGDGENKVVEYVGLFGINSMGEKYKISDTYLVNDDKVNGLLKYKFNKIGEYYLRFTSKDNSGNVSMLEYEVKVVDKRAPSIIGISNGKVMEFNVDDEFSVAKILENEGVVTSDNYDLTAKLYYEIEVGKEYTYDIILKASDSSNNVNTITFHVNLIDNILPVVGELIVAESTNLNSLEFSVVGGSDNSNNYYHEYSIQIENQEVVWNKYESTSKLEFGYGVSSVVNVCVRAVDFAFNISEDMSCKNVLVDNVSASVIGVSDGEIVSQEVTIKIEDDRLSFVELIKDNEVINFELDSLPITVSEEGIYSLIATDELGNTTVVNFEINVDAYVNIVDDIYTNNYVVNSVEFDSIRLSKVDVYYDNSGANSMVIDLKQFAINNKDMIYVLGVVPSTDYKFVIYSGNGQELKDYNYKVSLIDYGSKFVDELANEEFFLNINDYYYAYVIVKENVVTDPVVLDKKEENKNTSDLLTFGLIGAGTLITIMVGYQITRFKKRVRAA